MTRPDPWELLSDAARMLAQTWVEVDRLDRELEALQRLGIGVSERKDPALVQRVAAEIQAIWDVVRLADAEGWR